MIWSDSDKCAKCLATVVQWWASFLSPHLIIGLITENPRYTKRSVVTLSRAALCTMAVQQPATVPPIHRWSWKRFISGQKIRLQPTCPAQPTLLPLHCPSTCLIVWSSFLRHIRRSFYELIHLDVRINTSNGQTMGRFAMQISPCTEMEALKKS